jgi:hypothetical protein
MDNAHAYRGESIMKKDWVDFKRIREQVGIVDVLRHYGLFDEEHTGKEQIKIRCPWHEDNKPSCNVHGCYREMIE